MAISLETQLAEKNADKAEILRKIEERNGRKKIECASCDKPHAIKTLTLIQTYWYTPPSGCTGGDYWNEGEVNFICPETEVRNRLLFNNNEIPWEDRNKYENNPEDQFKANYKSLFKEVIDYYKEGHQTDEWVNNFYVDQNRKKFGLVEKRVS